LPIFSSDAAAWHRAQHPRPSTKTLPRPVPKLSFACLVAIPE
jgi:hypothetical protein